MSDLLSGKLAEQLVGVIDILEGRAVHAIAGERGQYRPVTFCDGDPITLANHYRGLGVNRLYIADLDSIAGREINVDAIDSISRLQGDQETLVDLGWTGAPSDEDRQVIEGLSSAHRSCRWIAATESCQSTEALESLAALVGPASVMLGLDFRAGELIADQGDEIAWVRAAAELKCHGVVVLDLATVGTGGGPSTADLCRRVHQQAPELNVYTGGGIRTAEDVRALQATGCEAYLVATALHPKS